ncbi:MAG: hypothetical protein HYX96_07025 [Chloroflexi bacterium]|nr:hypothetical protein [Chloroflexota bacterium]
MYLTDVVNPADLDGVEPVVVGGPIIGTRELFPLKILFNQPEATVAIENFLPGIETHWAFFHNEFQYILQGEAEVSYTLVPNHDKVNTVTIRKGQCYLILNGTRATFRVRSKEPYTHLAVIMPRYNMDRWLLKRDYDGVPLAEYMAKSGKQAE